MKKLVTFKELLRYAWRGYRSLVLIIMIENIFSAALPILNLVGIGVVIDALMKGHNKEYLLRLILIYTGLSLLISLTQTFFTYKRNIVTRKASDKIQLDYIRDGVIVDYHWAQDGSVLDMKKKSMGANPVFVFMYIGRFIEYILKFMGIIYIFSLLSPLFLVIIALTSVLSVFLTFKGRKVDFDLENERMEEARKLDYLYGLMTGYEYAKEVRINNLAPFILRKYSIISDLKLEKLKAFLKSKLRLDNLSTIITVFQSATMYLYFSYSVYIGKLTIAEYSVLLGAVSLLTSILIGFFDNIAIIDRMTARMDIFLEYKKWIRENSIIWETNEIPNVMIDLNRTEIRFENVSFRYPNTNKPIFQNLNFYIKDEQKVGIVGLNGAGKTTLVKLLLRLYIPTEGKIFLNDIDINTIPLDQYLERVCAVLQDFFIFAYSIKENITFGVDTNEEKLIDVMKKSGLTGKAVKLKDGMNTILYKELDENGIELSGGEEQKLALARALYKNGGLLILDEPTSTLDPVAEYNLFSSLRDISGGKTTIFISHRLSSTKFCDRIFVLDNGEIVEDGTHVELISRGGLYADLFESQAKLYRESEVPL